ncbi:MAG TPA: c-type cytochrome domain-containing protein [Balneolaceae bacterium]
MGLILASCSGSTGPNNGSNNGGNGGESPPPAEPTFTNVLDIFNSSCGGSGCHIGESTNGVRLDSYDAIMSSEGTQYGGPIVIEGEPDNSPLVDKIEEDPRFGARMPKGGTPLSNEQITLIRDWIAEGAQNN